ncbi:hypothetical protein T440DRAFT_194052 [Plenodomus tracheiphilus IPT5]|uniref:Uncharacterized protein n=1 Tax=Plenodomus tracheiphilus IPT5 TaxID=1408161 RepID=A0A6A7AZJ7_9PLEO|nr:hypothetical protein T440DRAFT_194052 [Plenodomus tracheiphilus IPT5]
MYDSVTNDHPSSNGINPPCSTHAYNNAPRQTHASKPSTLHPSRLRTNAPRGKTNIPSHKSISNHAPTPLALKKKRSYPPPNHPTLRITLLNPLNPSIVSLIDTPPSLPAELDRSLPLPGRGTSRNPLPFERERLRLRVEDAMDGGRSEAFDEDEDEAWDEDENEDAWESTFEEVEECDDVGVIVEVEFCRSRVDRWWSWVSLWL